LPLLPLPQSQRRRLLQPSYPTSETPAFVTVGFVVMSILVPVVKLAFPPPSARPSAERPLQGGQLHGASLDIPFSFAPARFDFSGSTFLSVPPQTLQWCCPLLICERIVDDGQFQCDAFVFPLLPFVLSLCFCTFPPNPSAIKNASLWHTVAECEPNPSTTCRISSKKLHCPLAVSVGNLFFLPWFVCSEPSAATMSRKVFPPEDLLFTAKVAFLRAGIS